MNLRKRLFAFKGVIIFALGVYALSYCVAALYVFSSQPERVMATGFGTARAPYSDALGPWLLGGLHAFFGLKQIDYLYRPTIGFFWGSIIALTNRVDFIPLFFLGAWVLILLAFLLLWRNTILGLALSLWIGGLAINFENSVLPLSPMSLTVDLASFVLTALGVFLIILGASWQKVMYLPCIVGGFVLGLAGAIRGPMMPGGLVFILCMLGIYRKTSPQMILSTLVAFLSPILMDALMQRYYHVYNNGLISLFCFYSDIAHAWNGECHRRFLELRPDFASIVRDYFTFVASDSGVSVLLAGFIGRIDRDVYLFSTRAWGSLLLLVSLYAGWKIWEMSKHGANAKCWRDLRMHAGSLWALFVFWSFFLASRFNSNSKTIPLLFVVACCTIAVKYKFSISLSLILAYLVACAFLTFVGLWEYERVALTFSFLLHMAALLLITQWFETDDSKLKNTSRAVSALSWSVVVIVAALYSCWAWWPSASRIQFLQQVEGRDAAVKVSDDKVIDRSLYFTGRHALFYTFSDDLPIGSVRHHINVKYPTRFWNESFLHPNIFVDE